MGAIAAITTAFCWAFSSLFFTSAGKEVGSVVVNRMRLLFAVILLSLAHWAFMGQPMPIHAGAERWFWLGLSGIIGLVLGDAALLQAYVLIGARISTLIMAIVPVISTLIAWIFLGERLDAIQVGGILLAVAGISMVVLERPNGQQLIADGDRKQYALGILLSFGGALGQALGLIFAKKGLAGDFPALSGVMVRMLVAMLVMWLLALAYGQIGKTFEIFTNRKALRAVASGSVVGPFIGVWLSLIAIQISFVGVASTLMALTPIIMLPISKWGYKERISRWAVAGTLVSMVGVAIIFLFP